MSKKRGKAVDETAGEGGESSSGKKKHKEKDSKQKEKKKKQKSEEGVRHRFHVCVLYA